MRTFLLVGIIATVGLAGCDQILGPDGGGLDPAEVVELSNALIQDGLDETSDTATSSVLADGLAFDTRTWTLEFTRTRDCALGGEVTTAGTRERTRDRETRTGTMNLDATRTFTDCARPLGDTATITLNGELALSVHREWQAGQWHGTQEVSLTGSLDWVAADVESGAELDSGTCEVDVSASFDPATRTRTVTGTVCGEDANELRGWSFGPAGHGPHAGGPHGGGMGG